MATLFAATFASSSASAFVFWMIGVHLVTLVVVVAARSLARPSTVVSRMVGVHLVCSVIFAGFLLCQISVAQNVVGALANPTLASVGMPKSAQDA